MKLFGVIYEVPGVTLKAPGISETEIKRVQLWFAAEIIDEVWTATAYIRDDPEKTFISISEAAELVTVIRSTPDGGDERGG